MAVISVRTNNEENDLFKSYTALHGISLSEALKRALLEKIEDEFDIEVADEAYKEYLESGCKTTSLKDFWKELDDEGI